MHLLKATPGGVQDGQEAVDLGQDPGEIVVLSAADTELANLAQARQDLGDAYPELRLANLMQLGHNMSVDLYLEQTCSSAKLIVVRLLGGANYWPYGVEQLQMLAETRGIQLALLPGDDQPDADLAQRSTVDEDAYHRLWQYCVHGGPANARAFLGYAAELAGHAGFDWAEPAPLLRAGLYWPGCEAPSLDDLRADWLADAPVAAIVFYRAHVQAANLAPVDALIRELQAAGVNALPLFCASLKEQVSADTVRHLLTQAGAGVVLNATGFAVSKPGAERSETPFDAIDAPVLQVVFSGGTEQAWRAGTNGLGARDIAMNVALPEVDGRILSRAVSFKAEARFDPKTQTSVVAYQPVDSRVRFAARLAANWLKLRHKSPQDRRVAVILANYPNRDARMGNGVGLDTPAGTVNLLRAMAETGYQTGDIPESGNALIETIAAGPTNAAHDGREIRETLDLSTYRAFFDRLPQKVREEVTERWGAPESDPFFLGDQDAFALPAYVQGNTAICLQPARGYNVDPEQTYHDPDLVPPHGYFAFYAWLREAFGADAAIHMGKHGNLEWLPGKALALDESCYPEATLGPLPHLYPFIVNDPGEGTQAKRRAQAAIVDHLTPPLTRAESYGPLAELERLADEYYEAAGVDPRRLELLGREILDLSARIGLDQDCGIERGDDTETALGKLDNYLCALKEMQIRDGLHVFGQAPEGRLQTDLLVALTRLPRGQGDGGDASLIRALAADLDLDEAFDPLDCTFGDPWDGPRPNVLADLGEGSWRTTGDTVERLENLAQALVAGARPADAAWTRTQAVLDTLAKTVRPAVADCGPRELAGVLTGLNGRFVEPGPSGAPTRGRLDVLPTGRNFYSVDTRVVPTPAAWQLGWKSATRLLERHRQEEGMWPKSLAVSAWGTANMRTGGDDLAQVLALMGVQPTWDTASRRVTGYEILPLSVLGRPRVDVTLRVSGFFRDAFPHQIDLIDSAARAVADLDEPADQNPLAAKVKADTQALENEGIDADTARTRAGHRVFGSKPGAYGAGLQALIDEKGWEETGDLARAYLAWGGYAYGGGSQGTAEHALFAERLGSVEGVVHNQDNREHDLLDSDDYYQFEGGLTATVRHLSGSQPKVWHNDHSRPESPQIRSLEEEVARVVRARVVNPKWIAGVMRHGYKGAFEMSATVDYLFAFAATAHAVKDHHFDAVYEAYLADDAVRAFLHENNPEALTDIADRLLEAQDRNLWQPRGNTTRPSLQAIKAGQSPEDVA
ncbi:cobaltochelatase subunit CobN [Rhodovibrio salinarum]|uniref:Cobaltochelatase subunit CobN n=1 Tax=Rhodovibrio salinarum TaxID=1087 RepID=A0A934QIU8_9PROT|nr:cobaltochelatase subunit CobN [Rhodovibrio salinarum]MBK1697584.1 cobaltochelatase subunit CobN [Rhodovibrio salinarum]